MSLSQQYTYIKVYSFLEFIFSSDIIIQSKLKNIIIISIL